MEHSRYACSPKNYPEEVLSIPYTKYHINCKPDLSFSILKRVKSTEMRKIRAVHIVDKKPKINLKEECTLYLYTALSLTLPIKTSERWSLLAPFPGQDW